MQEMFEWQQARDAEDRDYVPPSSVRIIGKKFIVVNAMRPYMVGKILTLVITSDDSIADLKDVNSTPALLFWYKLKEYNEPNN